MKGMVNLYMSNKEENNNDTCIKWVYPGFFNTYVNETLIKIPVESILFIVNYFIQKIFIFKGENMQNTKKRIISI